VCLGAKPTKDAVLGVLQEGTKVTVAGREVEVDGEGEPVVVCSDLTLPPAAGDGGTHLHAVALGRGLAVLLLAESTALHPIPSDEGGWKQLRRRVREDAQQVGCLKRLKVGTVLYDKPDGAELGRVVDGTIPYGKWDFVQTKTSGWALLKVNVGFGALEAWIKDKPRDWCPE
jgi:hypothetical protein